MDTKLRFSGFDPLVAIYSYTNGTLNATELELSHPALLCWCEQTISERWVGSAVFGGGLKLVLHMWKAGVSLAVFGWLSKRSGLVKIPLFHLWKEIVSCRQFSALDDSAHSVQMM